MRRVLGSLVVGAVLLVGGSGVAVAAGDDGLAPRLASRPVVLTPEVGPGESLRIAYAVESDQTRLSPTQGSGLVFGSTDVRIFDTPVLSLRGRELTGEVELAISPSTHNGRYCLTSASLAEDVADGTVRYRRAIYRTDGTVTYQPVGTTGPTTHGTDLVDLCFEYTGSTLDAVPPMLSSVSTSPRTVVATGGTFTLSAALTEPVRELTATWDGAAGDGIVSTWRDVSADAVLTVDVPGDQLPTSYALREVKLTDPAGNTTTSLRDGTWSGMTTYHRIVNGRHDVSFAPADVRVGSAPEAPYYVRATAAPGGIAVDFDGFGSSGYPLTAWIVTAAPAGVTLRLAPTARRATLNIPGVNSVQTVTVQAVNAIGTSPGTSSRATTRDAHRILSPGDWDADGDNDLMAANASGQLYLFRNNGAGRISGSAVKVGSSGWQQFRQLSQMSGPTIGRADPAAAEIAAFGFDGIHYWYDGRPPVPRIGPDRGDFSNFREVLHAGDVSGDGWPADLLGVSDDGGLYVVPWSWNASTPTNYPRSSRIGNGWNTFRQVVAAGDVTGDRRPDLFAIRPDGTMLRYAGNGRGGFGSGVVAGRGWNVFAEVFSPGDFTGDARADLIGVTPAGDMYLYRGNGNGGFTGGGTKIGTGWKAFL